MLPYILAAILMIIMLSIFVLCVFAVGARAEDRDQQAWENFSKSGDCHAANILRTPVHPSAYAEERHHHHA